MVKVCLPIKQYIEQFRDQKRFYELCTQCSNFNKRWSCPPYHQDFEEIFASYNYIYILGEKFATDLSFKQIRTTHDKKMLELESKYPNSRAMLAGSCIVCEQCAKPEPCTHPELMRYSLESMGFDVSKTASELLGIEIKWGRKLEYYTLVSALCTKEKIEL